MVIPRTGTVTISPAISTLAPPASLSRHIRPSAYFSSSFAQFYFIPAAVIPIAAPLTIDITPDNVWKSTYDTFSALHGINGILLIPTTILVLIMLSFAARHPWKTTGLTALLLLLLVFQFALALIGFQHSDLAPIAGLHGLNAVLLVGLGLRLTWQRWAF
jgi:Family of unknown function (DUF6220)